MKNALSPCSSSSVTTAKAHIVVRLIFMPLPLSTCSLVLTCSLTCCLFPINSALTPPAEGLSVQTTFITTDAKKNPFLQLPSERELTRSVASSLVHPRRPPPPTATPFWPNSWSSGVPAAQRHQAHSKKAAQLRADEGQFSLFKNKARSDTTSL